MQVLEEGENYDSLDRVIADKYKGAARYKYQYDGAGNLGFHEDLVNGVNYRYVYDLSDRLVKVTDTKGNNLTYGYDKDNNVDKVTEKIGTETYVTSYAFDNDNRIKTITIPKSTNTISYVYDSIERLKTSTIVIGTSQFVTTNNYDAGGKLQSVNLPGSRNISYTYDANGNIETITEAGKTIKYYYNELNELIREDNQVLDKTIVYLYDAGGNILSKIEYAYTTGSTLPAPTKTISYTYGDANWKDKLTAYNGTPITYDAIGNPTEYGIYKYNWEGRQLKSMEPVTPGQAPVVTFKYNSEGIRTEKQVGNVVTKYHVVGDRVTFEENGTDKIYYTYGGDGNIISMNLNGVEYYYVRNAQGDIIGLLDGNGVEVVSYVYDSWGKLMSTIGALKDTVGSKNPYRYRGYRYDVETGYYYLNSRYYNPNWGRFLNADGIVGTLGELLSHNMFTYCDNNPVVREDSSGYIWGVLALAAGFVVTAFSIPFAVAAAVVIVATVAVVVTAAYATHLVVDHYSARSGISNSDTKGGQSKEEKTSRKPNKGRTKNKLKPDPEATGDHTVTKRNPDTGEITNYETYKKNPNNPNGFDKVKRYDKYGDSHFNKVTREHIPTPHVHDVNTPGGVRNPIPWEIPK